MKKGFVIAIDGPSAAGKGALSKRLATYLNGYNIYSGGIYRALALKCIHERIDVDNEVAVEKVLNTTNIVLKTEDNIGIIASLYLDGKDITQEIRNTEPAIEAGKIARYKKVRDWAAQQQRKLAESAIKKGQIVISDGQDSGTYVFPNAACKIFLFPSAEIRAKRRELQYLEEGKKKKFKDVLQEIKKRDEQDFTRKLRPLSSNPVKDGYFVIDNSNLAEEETFEKTVKELKRKQLI